VRRLRPAAIAVAAAAVAGVAGGCGTPSPDLFVVNRTGTIPGATLVLRAIDDGTVVCNGKEHDGGSDRLITARKLQRELAPLAERGLTVATTEQSVLRYRVRLEEGVITFPDTATRSRPVLARLVAYVRDVARNVCGLPR
jgi:hypothetical protein